MAGAMLPTWVEMRRRRRAWKASPRGRAGVLEPNQLASTMRASKAALERAVRRPDSVAEAWTISSWSAGALAGRAKRAPNWVARRALAGSMSIRVTMAAGMRARSEAVSRPTIPAPTTRMRSPARGAASQAMLSAVSMLAARVARWVGTAAGTGMHMAAGALNAVWCGCRTKKRWPAVSWATAL